MIDFQPLSDFAFHIYEKEIIFPHSLRTLTQFEHACAFGASIKSTPIGVILAKIAKSKAELLTLYVQSTYRNQGVGKTLLHCLEQELFLRGCHSLNFNYLTTGSFENFLKKQLWVEGSLCTLLYTILNPQIPFRFKIFKNQKFTVSSFVDITEKEKKWLKDHPEMAPQGLHPFIPQDEMPLEPLNSLVLRKEGEIKGWMITHRLCEEAIRYSQLYVMPEEQKLGNGARLVYEAASRQLAVCNQIPKALWCSSNKNLTKKIFLERNDFTVMKQLEKKLYTIYEK